MRDLWDWFLDHLGRMFIAAVVIVVLVLFGAVLYNFRGVSGTVVGKDYSPMQVIPQTQCAPNTNGGCTIVTTQTIIPESWNLIVEPDDGSENVTRSVDPAYWETVEVGDRWTDD